MQVLNDLLDPSRTNLRLREDPRKGIYVEGIKEETLLSAEHALQARRGAAGAAAHQGWGGLQQGLRPVLPCGWPCCWRGACALTHAPPAAPPTLRR